MTEPVVIEQRGQFNVKPFRGIAAKGWNEIFKDFDLANDLAHWFIDGLSSSVRVTARQIDLNEYAPEWKTSTTVIMGVEGFFETLPEGKVVPTKKMILEFTQWVENGILESFNSKRIENKFEKLGLMDKPFTVVTSRTDAGLAEDELTILWTNDKKNATPSKINARQIAAQRGKRARVKKKKT